MGNCTQRLENIYETEPSLVSMRPVFEALQLSPNDVGRLFKMFCSFDQDRSGYVSTHELFATLAQDSITFRDRVFTLFDEDKSGQIDFHEFVLTLWNYCTLSKTALVVFAFDLYDTDGTGCLSMREVEGMLTDLYGKQAATHSQATKIYKDLHSFDADHPITIKIFQSFVRNHPALLFPAFQMQLGLQEHILGRRFWDTCAEKRIALASGKEVHVGAVSDWNIRVGGGNTATIHPDVEQQHGKNHSPDHNKEEEHGVLHPKDEIAKIILKATGTLHHRRAQQYQQQQKLKEEQERALSAEKDASTDRQLGGKRERKVAADDLLLTSSHYTASTSGSNSRHLTNTNATTPKSPVNHTATARPTSRNNHSRPSSASPDRTQPTTDTAGALCSPRPSSQAEAQVFDHFFTPKHLLPSVQQHFQQSLNEQHQHIAQTHGEHHGHHNHRTQNRAQSPLPNQHHSSAQHTPTSTFHSSNTAAVAEQTSLSPRASTATHHHHQHQHQHQHHRDSQTSLSPRNSTSVTQHHPQHHRDSQQQQHHSHHNQQQHQHRH